MAAAHDLSTLHLAGIDDLDMLVAPAVQFLRRYPLAEHATSASAPLSETERRLLREGGLVGLEENEADERFVKASLASVVGAYAALVAGAYGAREAAERLGVVPSRVRQRVTERSLYAIEGPTGRVFPRFQFAANGTLPGLRHVLRAISAEAHPVAVERFFRIPVPDLHSAEVDESLSVRDWLLAGHPVAPVVVLAGEL